MLLRWNWVDSFIPYWSDPELRWYYKRYRFADDEELRRKLDVCRRAILRGNRVDSFNRKQDVLWAITTKRERTGQRRAWLAELTGWTKLMIAFLALTGFTSVLAFCQYLRE